MTAPGPAPESGVATTAAISDLPFAVALRGYDRRQVDDFVARQNGKIARLTTEVSDAKRQGELASEHVEALKKQLRELRARPPRAEPAPAEDGFGYRAERLLRLAEQEAGEARANATRESAAIIEKARTEAEAHRHEVEQTLISRASTMEQQAALRTAELQEREQQIADQLADARDQAEQLHSAAVRAAEALREESETAAQEKKRRADDEVRRARDQAAQEITRLHAVQADARTELARLAEMLTAELSGRRGARPGSAPRDGRDPLKGGNQLSPSPTPVANASG